VNSLTLPERRPLFTPMGSNVGIMSLFDREMVVGTGSTDNRAIAWLSSEG
jgi:hypothetical protein